ncbi:unnamed protein product [Moneuplotes crassus]|uniref:Uncharacterized protein n=1 Tax=Euplotes crassus TaxID=5936 RepID=A0AAD1U774_EUPCR|nr:unnamed protein product [Moneuplotes crassus]
MNNNVLEEVLNGENKLPQLTHKRKLRLRGYRSSRNTSDRTMVNKPQIGLHRIGNQNLEDLEKKLKNLDTEKLFSQLKVNPKPIELKKKLFMSKNTSQTEPISLKKISISSKTCEKVPRESTFGSLRRVNKHQLTEKKFPHAGKPINSSPVVQLSTRSTRAQRQSEILRERRKKMLSIFDSVLDSSRLKNYYRNTKRDNSISYRIDDKNIAEQNIIVNNKIKINGSKIHKCKYTVTHTQADAYEESMEDSSREGQNTTLEDIKGCIDRINVVKHSRYGGKFTTIVNQLPLKIDDSKHKSVRNNGALTQTINIKCGPSKESKFSMKVNIAKSTESFSNSSPSPRRCRKNNDKLDQRITIFDIQAQTRRIKNNKSKSINCTSVRGPIFTQDTYKNSVNRKSRNSNKSSSEYTEPEDDSGICNIQPIYTKKSIVKKKKLPTFRQKKTSKSYLSYLPSLRPHQSQNEISSPSHRIPKVAETSRKRPEVL